MKPLFQDDTELLNRLKDDDRSAFEVMYRRHWQQLYDFALMKTHDADVAEEIIQDLFVTIWEKRESLHIQNLRSYLFTAVRNRVIDHYKEKIFAEIDNIEPPQAPEYSFFLEELEATMQHSIAKLPIKTQRIFLLNRFEGHTVRQISTELNLPERTVEYHITQALRIMKTLLKEFIAPCLVAFVSSIY
ncbi:sigma-70 family RNA polymerase sigma factor [Dyadobacter sp. CY347]|uniref:sigma-70 family RNA polymerase sigma factor n=1 Tax=Dyadobacter sp. CY347 TaxID=2909336 RepID=UPI001F40F9D2|nr:sigma-70 family RNA polymerase sigma factor [Dyadobacter sp. CY347]MCF2489258.1 sigma-70 family RNA polymerase sigma factor [Dyadobacter sp. CY347]